MIRLRYEIAREFPSWIDTLGIPALTLAVDMAEETIVRRHPPGETVHPSRAPAIRTPQQVGVEFYEAVVLEVCASG